MTNEWGTHQHEGEERMEIQGHVDKHKEAFETTKQDMEVGKRMLFEDELQPNIEVVTKEGAFLYAFIGDEGACAIPKGWKEFLFSYSDWHASDVAGMNHRSTSLDVDTRLIPPRNDTLYLGIRGRVDKIPVLALKHHDPEGPPLVSFDVDEERRRSTGQSCIFDPGGHVYQSFDRNWKRSEAIIGTCIIVHIRCHTIVGYRRTKLRSHVFDPGGDISPKLLLLTLFIVSWFPP